MLFPASANPLYICKFPGLNNPFFSCWQLSWKAHIPPATNFPLLFSTRNCIFLPALAGSSTAEVLSTVPLSKALPNEFCLNPPQLPEPISAVTFSQCAADWCGIGLCCVGELAACQGAGTGGLCTVRRALQGRGSRRCSLLLQHSPAGAAERNGVLAQHCFLQKAAHREGVFRVEVLNGTRDIVSSFLAVLGQRLDWVTWSLPT